MLLYKQERSSEICANEDILMKNNFISKKHIELNVTAMGASNTLVKKYDDIIDLSLGDVDFKTPELIINKAMEDALAGRTHYIDFLGDKELLYTS